MPSLREVKDRIASVRSTLKITSAMKLVASSKLRKAQRSIENLRPYEETLSRILSALPQTLPQAAPDAESTPEDGEKPQERTIVLAFAGNTSMCGAFNANAVKRTQEVVNAAGGDVEVWAFGRKMAEALRKGGQAAARDYSSLVADPEFEASRKISEELRALSAAGECSRVVMVYNHFFSTGKQAPVEEQLLPFLPPERETSAEPEDAGYYIYEPSASALAGDLVPQVTDLKLYAALLDSVAAEHAARMVAMQAATDNGQDLLSELTLEYNKGRQQKITSEILDLVSGGSES